MGTEWAKTKKRFSAKNPGICAYGSAFCAHGSAFCAYMEARFAHMEARSVMFSKV
jgi:hypothetical protein